MNKVQDKVKVYLMLTFLVLGTLLQAFSGINIAKADESNLIDSLTINGESQSTKDPTLEWKDSYTVDISISNHGKLSLDVDKDLFDITSNSGAPASEKGNSIELDFKANSSASLTVKPKTDKAFSVRGTLTYGGIAAKTSESSGEEDVKEDVIQEQTASISLFNVSDKKVESETKPEEVKPEEVKPEEVKPEDKDKDKIKEDISLDDLPIDDNAEDEIKVNDLMIKPLGSLASTEDTGGDVAGTVIVQYSISGNTSKKAKVRLYYSKDFTDVADYSGKVYPYTGGSSYLSTLVNKEENKDSTKVNYGEFIKNGRLYAYSEIEVPVKYKASIEELTTSFSFNSTTLGISNYTGVLGLQVLDAETNEVIVDKGTHEKKEKEVEYTVLNNQKRELTKEMKYPNPRGPNWDPIWALYDDDFIIGTEKELGTLTTGTSNLKTVEYRINLDRPLHFFKIKETLPEGSQAINSQALNFTKEGATCTSNGREVTIDFTTLKPSSKVYNNKAIYIYVDFPNTKNGIKKTNEVEAYITGGLNKPLTTVEPSKGVTYDPFKNGTIFLYEKDSTEKTSHTFTTKVETVTVTPPPPISVSPEFVQFEKGISYGSSVLDTTDSRKEYSKKGTSYYLRYTTTLHSANIGVVDANSDKNNPHILTAEDLTIKDLTLEDNLIDDRMYIDNLNIEKLAGIKKPNGEEASFDLTLYDRSNKSYELTNLTVSSLREKYCGGSVIVTPKSGFIEGLNKDNAKFICGFKLKYNDPVLISSVESTKGNFISFAPITINANLVDETKNLITETNNNEKMVNTAKLTLTRSSLFDKPELSLIGSATVKIYQPTTSFKQGTMTQLFNSEGEGKEYPVYDGEKSLVLQSEGLIYLYSSEEEINKLPKTKNIRYVLTIPSNVSLKPFENLIKNINETKDKVPSYLTEDNNYIQYGLSGIYLTGSERKYSSVSANLVRNYKDKGYTALVVDVKDLELLSLGEPTFGVYIACRDLILDTSLESSSFTSYFDTDTIESTTNETRAPYDRFLPYLRSSSYRRPSFQLVSDELGILENIKGKSETRQIPVSTAFAHLKKESSLRAFEAAKGEWDSTYLGSNNISTTKPNGTIDYNLKIINQLSFEEKNIVALSVLPRVGDTYYTLNREGNLLPRETQTNVYLTGAIPAPKDGTTIYYTLDSPPKTEKGMSDWVDGANWVPESEVKDFSKVTAVKAVDISLLAGQTLNWQFSVRTEGEKDLWKTSNSSFLLRRGTGLIVESNVVKTKITPNPYNTLSGKKVWDDDSNAQSKRPESITIKVLQDGVEYKSIQLQAKDFKDKDEWDFSIEDLPSFDPESNKVYVYTLDEVDVPEYEKSITGTTVTNSLGGRGTLTIDKVDSTDDKLFLKDAEFELYNDKGEKVGDTLVTTDKDGKYQQIKVEKLNFGKYTLKETKAPQGYDGLVTKEITIDKNNKDVVIKVENTKESELPFTGNEGVTSTFLLTIAIAAFALGLYSAKKQKEY